jgi:hypothetical protein
VLRDQLVLKDLLMLRVLQPLLRKTVLIMEEVVLNIAMIKEINVVVEILENQQDQVADNLLTIRSRLCWVELLKNKVP